MFNGVHIHLRIRCRCNLKCWYCVANNSRESIEEYDLNWLDGVYQRIKSDNIITNLECGASEPSMHPQIKDILKIAIKHGKVSIPTNNTRDFEDWVPQPYEKVLLRCALHPYNEENLEKFITRIKQAQENGIDTACVFCAVPNAIEKGLQYKELFVSHKIKFSFMPFNGSWNGYSYPQSYTGEQRRLFKQGGWYEMLKPYMFIRDFSGIPCLAGKNLLYVYPGHIRRCLYDTTPIDSFDKVLPCKVHYCGCGLFLKALNTWMSEEGDMRKKYFDLMFKYGKLDIEKIKEVYKLS